MNSQYARGRSTPSRRPTPCKVHARAGGSRRAIGSTLGLIVGRRHSRRETFPLDDLEGRSRGDTCRIDIDAYCFAASCPVAVSYAKAALGIFDASKACSAVPPEVAP